MVDVGSAPSVLQLGTSQRGPEGEGQSPHKASFKQKQGNKCLPTSFFSLKASILCWQGRIRSAAAGAAGARNCCVFSLELSSERLTYFLPLNQPVGVVGMLGRASILHHHAICLRAAFWD